MNLESYFISQFTDLRIGDDGAFIDGYVYSKDAFFENVHFKKEWMSHYQIAQKAMIVNISDSIAMNATPKYILLSVAMPKNITKEQMRDLARGFSDTAKKYGCEIIGGDTISNTKLDITITVIGKTSRPLYRSGIKKGFLIGYTGKIGNAKKDLKKLFNKGFIHKKSKFVNSELRVNFMKRNEKILRAGMDISDGLFTDLDKFAKINRLGFKFFSKIPKEIGCSGEEYEILFAIDPRDKKALERRAKVARTKVTFIATAVQKKYSNRCKSHHF
ncbi:MAG: thiamine-phosphate kinase [Atribacterota bacterium]|nr:thiamine-phosphate kinase [Atribacterota bacterium]